MYIRLSKFWAGPVRSSNSSSPARQKHLLSLRFSGPVAGSRAFVGKGGPRRRGGRPRCGIGGREGRSRGVGKRPARGDEFTALCINRCTSNRLGLAQKQYSSKRFLLAHKNAGAPLFLASRRLAFFGFRLPVYGMIVLLFLELIQNIVSSTVNYCHLKNMSMCDWSSYPHETAITRTTTTSTLD